MNKSKSEILRFRISTELFATLTAQARQLGLRPSELARFLLATQVAVGGPDVTMTPSDLLNAPEPKES